MYIRSHSLYLFLTTLLFSALLAGCAAPAPTPTGSPTPPPTDQPAATPVPALTTPELARQDLEAGIAFHDAHDYAAAVEAFSDALEKDPDLSEAYFRRALSYYLDYNLEAALADIETGFEMGFEPETASQYVVRGRAYSLQDRNAEAMADFEEAIALDPAYPEAYVRRANMLAFTFNDPEGALEDLNTAIELDPAYALAYQKRGSVHRIRNAFDLAIADLNRAIELDPAEPFYLSVMGEIYLAQSEFETAITYLTAALNQDERIAEAYYYRSLAAAVIDYGDFPHGLADMQEYVRRVPEDPTGYYFLGLLSLDQALYEEAISYFEQAIALGLDANGTSAANQYITTAEQQLKAKDLYPQLLITFEEAGEAGGTSWLFNRDNIWEKGGCRYFNSAPSDSGTGLTEFFNCAIELGPDVSLDDYADLYPDVVPLTPAFEYPGDFAVYGYLDEAPHFEIQVLRNGFLHVVNVTAGAPVEPEGFQAAFSGPVEEFMHAVMTLALARTEIMAPESNSPAAD